jgi:hypothetical protein
VVAAKAEMEAKAGLLAALRLGVSTSARHIATRSLRAPRLPTKTSLSDCYRSGKMFLPCTP